jgi:tetratricopeptide (TPR) repeat protein
MENFDEIKYIEAWFEESLSADDRREFEEKMKNDEAFRNRVADFEAALKCVEYMGRSELKTKLKEIHSEVVGTKQNMNGRLWLRIAAIFVGLMVIASPFIYRQYIAAPNFDNLFSENFSAYPDILSQRSSSSNPNIMLQEAMSYYKNSDFENAVVLFQHLINNATTENDALNFYLGVSMLGNDDLPEAQTVLSKISANPENEFHDQAKWYLGLVYFKAGNDKGAKEVFNEIALTKSYNHKKAQRLLDELD